MPDLGWQGERHVRRKIHTWSLAGTVHPAFQAAVLLDSLSEDAALLTQHL